ncbi:hypothetical protein QYM36_009420 [Artemia franciscana]|uniref:R3H-associated N-terminal domain-containing protein n=1 Tax=Artemia franciscana TaxID=6661 RepID=A0AA88HWP4_ARTSF|nr:hypothetical protein QYM36_009420 [Artemia franciscana]
MGVLEKKILPVLDGKQIPPPIHQSTETINIRSRESSIESAARSVSGRQPTGYQVFFSRPGQKTEKRIFESYSQQSRFSRCGTKKQRRRDNFHSLLALREEGDELTTQDIIPNSQSVFALLLQDPAKMEAWNVFLACSEEEQDEILASQSLWVDGLDQPSTIHQEESYQTKFEFEDKRLLHPGYTSMEAFDRLSGKLKTVLKRKKLPLVFFWTISVGAQ